MGMHSPAPWEKNGNGDGVFDGEGKEVVIHGLPMAHGLKTPRSTANGNLVLAAADMFAALEAITEGYAYHYGEDCPLTIKCREAIRKAKGGNR